MTLLQRSFNTSLRLKPPEQHTTRKTRTYTCAHRHTNTQTHSDTETQHRDPHTHTHTHSYTDRDRCTNTHTHTHTHMHTHSGSRQHSDSRQKTRKTVQPTMMTEAVSGPLRPWPCANPQSLPTQVPAQIFPWLQQSKAASVEVPH